MNRCAIKALPVVAVLWVMPTPGAAETVVPVGSFKTVALHSGGRVILRHGTDYRVRVLEGSAEYVKIEVTDGEHLVIERCPGDCQERYKPVIEVVAPTIDAIKVTDGGTIETRGTYPRQANLLAAVQNGGVLDLRAMSVQSVSASVYSGGRILTTPRKDLRGRVEQGGAITYWGEPTVMSAIEHGGVVARGRRADLTKPLHELGAAVEDLVPPVPPVPPIPPIPSRGGS